MNDAGNIPLLSPDEVKRAHMRMAPYLTATPLLESSLLNQWMGHRILFKAEGFQKIGAFKFRGALNALLVQKEQDHLPAEVVAYSSGNHAQAVAYVCQLLGIRATIIIPSFTSPVKVQATRSYGAQVIITTTRREAEDTARAFAAKGAFLLPPADHDDLIAGQGTACYEALQKDPDIEAVFATCGSGGLLAGSWLAAQHQAPGKLVFGGEPLNANDAAQSLRAGKIVGFPATPETIADGAATLCLSERTFAYIKRIAGILEVAETDIIYWTQWLTHLLKITVEPTAAVAMAAAAQWLNTQGTPRRVLIMLSGANVSADSQRRIWAKDYLEILPGTPLEMAS